MGGKGLTPQQSSRPGVCRPQVVHHCKARLHTPSNPIQLPAAGVCRRSAADQNPGPSGHYDDGSLNPAGRDPSDYSVKATAPLLKGKKLVILSTFNAFTIREESRCEELAGRSQNCGSRNIVMSMNSRRSGSKRWRG